MPSDSTQDLDLSLVQCCLVIEAISSLVQAPVIRINLRQQASVYPYNMVLNHHGVNGRTRNLEQIAVLVIRSSLVQHGLLCWQSSTLASLNYASPSQAKAVDAGPQISDIYQSSIEWGGGSVPTGPCSSCQYSVHLHFATASFTFYLLGVCYIISLGRETPPSPNTN